MGTAFAIDPHTLLTCRHVLDSFESSESGFYLWGPGYAQAQKVKTFILHEHRDIALLHIDVGAPAIETVLSVGQGLAEHDEVWSCGFNDREGTCVMEATRVNHYRNDVSTYGLSSQAAKGRSGGCLVYANGEVGGVVQATSQQQDCHYGISVASFRDWLGQHWVPASPPLTAIQQECIDAIRVQSQEAHSTQTTQVTQVTQVTQENFDKSSIQAHLPHLLTRPIKNRSAYALSHIAHWYNSPTQIDECFVRLIVMVDHGPQHEQGQFLEKSTQRFDDLQAAIDSQADDYAWVLLGRPGCGKSTLLKQLRVQCSLQALRSKKTVPLPFYVELNRYPPESPSNLEPLNWLQDQWQINYPELPPLRSYLEHHAVLFLCDALNEMRCGDHKEYERLIASWRTTLLHCRERYPNSRFLFSCRSLDYSAPLSDFDRLPVPQIRFAELSDDTVKTYLQNYLPQDWASLYAHLNSLSGFALEKTPFYLHLAVMQYKRLGHLPQGPSALIAGMIWLSLERELANPASSSVFDAVLTVQDRQRIMNATVWQQAPHQLPTDGDLIPLMIQLAWHMQRHHQGQGQASKQIHLKKHDILFTLKHQFPEHTIETGLTLATRLEWLELDLLQTTYKFHHQLLQEYFAAHQLIHEPLAPLSKAWLAVRRPSNLWHHLQHRFGVFQRETENTLKPTLDEVRHTLGVADPLPPPPPSGWEQTALHAAAIHPNQETWIAELQQQDLELSARCLLQGEVQVSAALITQIQQALLQRCQNDQADLRVRVQAGLTLGHVGDPRFQRVQGVDAEYIPPPLANIPGGTYTLGSKNPEDNALPIHQVTVADFQLGQYSVTNAEYECFIQAGGYEDERWWQSCEQAQLWWQGKLEQTERIEWWLNTYQRLTDDFEGALKDEFVHWTTRDIVRWKERLETPKNKFEASIRMIYKPQKYRLPANWDDNNFNNPSQPIVSISWYEALAYCSWLSHQSGQRFDLANEAQWRIAAHGLTRLIYPWGQRFVELYANTYESHLLKTTPVGMFIAGRTPNTNQRDQSLYDMAGNICDWCLNAYEPYPISNIHDRNIVNSEKHRVITGGSWNLSHKISRTACRYGERPSLGRFNYVGFRVLSHSR